MDTVDVQGDQAVTDVVTMTKRGPYRQTRFYRRTAQGWQPIGADTVFWGLERRLETAHFVYHFRQRDAEVVHAVAPQIDTLYTTLGHNFGLPITSRTEKLVIDVSVTHPTGQAPPWYGAPARIRVPSPARYVAPSN